MLQAKHIYQPMEKVSIQITKPVCVAGRAYSPGEQVTVQRTDAHYLIATGDAIPQPSEPARETRKPVRKTRAKAK